MSDITNYREFGLPQDIWVNPESARRASGFYAQAQQRFDRQYQADASYLGSQVTTLLAKAAQSGFRVDLGMDRESFQEVLSDARYFAQVERDHPGFTIEFDAATLLREVHDRALGSLGIDPEGDPDREMTASEVLNESYEQRVGTFPPYRPDPTLRKYPIGAPLNLIEAMEHQYYELSQRLLPRVSEHVQALRASSLGLDPQARSSAADLADMLPPVESPDATVRYTAAASLAEFSAYFHRADVFPDLPAGNDPQRFTQADAEALYELSSTASDALWRHGSYINSTSRLEAAIAIRMHDPAFSREVLAHQVNLHAPGLVDDLSFVASQTNGVATGSERSAELRFSQAVDVAAAVGLLTDQGFYHQAPNFLGSAEDFYDPENELEGGRFDGLSVAAVSGPPDKVLHGTLADFRAWNTYYHDAVARRLGDRIREFGPTAGNTLETGQQPDSQQPSDIWERIRANGADPERPDQLQSAVRDFHAQRLSVERNSERASIAATLNSPDFPRSYAQVMLNASTKTADLIALADDVRIGAAQARRSLYEHGEYGHAARYEQINDDLRYGYVRQGGLVVADATGRGVGQVEARVANQIGALNPQDTFVHLLDRVHPQWRSEVEPSGVPGSGRAVTPQEQAERISYDLTNTTGVEGALGVLVDRLQQQHGHSDTLLKDSGDTVGIAARSRSRGGGAAR